ncbi:glycerophosphoryl diester phosphodiesterase [Muriicola jejuensis]|uniref:Glycerophosphodiester phosphodiesterase n=2 Tax=Muriicola jejuensis TaxID=504488 RepID=A0A6P0UF31_9FLAO|nr:glycerophosphodiester phosphodiesterase [Muriicola jejuensis]SMP01201.1 glycerophosphoryl diester phosphodiesterase [Muriicola jejuensis]
MKRIFILIVFCTVAGCSETGRNMKVIGHRGAMGHETENTLASVQKALDLGVDMIEIDVFRVKSGEIVVFHDERLERLSNAGGFIEDWNYFELRKVILEGNHRIPMLQDVLKLVDHRVPLNIELKGANTSDRVNFIMEYYIKERGWKPEDFLISSFNWEELRSMRNLNPNVAIAVLTESDPVEAISVAKELGAVAINPNYRNVTAENVEALHEAGFKVYTWTVNEKEDIEAMRKYGVDGVFTNFPERAQ